MSLEASSACGPATYAVVTTVGRRREQSLLRSMAEGTGPPQLAMVSGPAGIGKTTLVHTVLDAFDRALVVRCIEGAVPLSGWDDALGFEVNGVDAVRRVHELTVLARQALAPAGRVAKRGAVVVEDAHWADRATLQVAARLAATADLAADVILTYRDDEVGGENPLVDLLPDLRRRSRTIRLPLVGLTRGELALLVEQRTGRRADRESVALLHARTAGNPFHATELLATGVDPAELHRAVLPPSAVDAVAVRVDRLPPVERDVLEAIAVLEVCELPDDLAALTDHPRPLLESAVAGLLGAGLLTAEGHRLTCRHALVREAVMARLAPETALRLHGGALRLAADPALRMRHAAATGDGVTATAEAVRGARERLELGFAVDALALAEDGLELSTSQDTSCGLRCLAARAALSAGLFGRAQTHGRAWLRAARDDDDASEVVEAALLLADVAWHAGDLAAGHGYLDEALGAAERSGGHRQRAAVAVARAGAAMREEHPEADARCAAALDAAAGEPALLLDAQITRATIDMDVDPDGARRAFDVLLDDALALGDPVAVGRICNNSLSLQVAGLAPTDVWERVERARATAQRHGAGFVLGKIARGGMDIAIDFGDLHTARAIAAERLQEETDPVEALTLASKDGLLAVEAGMAEDASAVLRAYRPVAQQVQIHWARTYYALLDVEWSSRFQGKVAAEQALERYAGCVRADDHALRPGRAVLAGTAALDAGVPHEVVREILERALSRVPRVERRPLRARLDLVAADLARQAPAVLELDGEIRMGELWEDQPAIRADHLRRVASALEVLGRAEQARTMLMEARELLVDWPGWRQDAVEAALVRNELLSSLTPREGEVAQLLVDGRTNAEIAHRLGNAERTVAVHVTRILAKTGCRSRTELVSRALRNGWLDGG